MSSFRSLTFSFAVVATTMQPPQPLLALLAVAALLPIVGYLLQSSRGVNAPVAWEFLSSKTTCSHIDSTRSCT